MLIIAWKAKHNVLGVITVSRFLVEENSIYYYVVGDQNSGQHGEHILNNIVVIEVQNINNQDDVDRYVGGMRGRHCVSVTDGTWSTNMNIELHRLKVDIEGAILAYHDMYRGKYNIWDGPHPIRHFDSIVYGDVNDIDTESELNGSICSSGTKQFIEQDCVDELNTILGFDAYIKNIKDWYGHADKHNIFAKYRNEIYQDTVAYKKAMMRYPEMHAELLKKHINIWRNSQYGDDMAQIFGWGG